MRLIARGCLVAGVLLLVGPGWALLAAGVLLLVRDEMAEAWLVSRRDDVTRVGRWFVRVPPRRRVAGASMGAGLLFAPAGAFLSFGVGIAVLVAAFLLLGLSLLTGQGA